MVSLPPPVLGPLCPEQTPSWGIVLPVELLMWNESVVEREEVAERQKDVPSDVYWRVLPSLALMFDGRVEPEG